MDTLVCYSIYNDLLGTQDLVPSEGVVWKNPDFCPTSNMIILLFKCSIYWFSIDFQMLLLWLDVHRENPAMMQVSFQRWNRIFTLYFYIPKEDGLTLRKKNPLSTHITILIAVHICHRAPKTHTKYRWKPSHLHRHESKQRFCDPPRCGGSNRLAVFADGHRARVSPVINHKPVFVTRWAPKGLRVINGVITYNPPYVAPVAHLFSAIYTGYDSILNRQGPPCFWTEAYVWTMTRLALNFFEKKPEYDWKHPFLSQRRKL